MSCCDTHVQPLCCDPLDCGPCCPNCPTCPTERPELLDWMTETERSQFAVTAISRAQHEDDPRYWTGTYLDGHGRYGCRDHDARRRSQLRWAWLAARLNPDQFADDPAKFYQRQQEATGQ